MWRKILWSVLFVFIVLVAATGWLVATQSGLSSAVSLAQKMVPGLKIEHADGRLIDQIHLQQVSYRPENASGADIKNIVLEWQPAALLKATFLVEELAVSDVIVYLATTEASETEALSLPEVALPLRIEIVDLTVNNVRTQNADKDAVAALNQLSTSLNLNYDALQITHFELDRDDVFAQLKGGISLQSPYSMNLEYTAELKQAISTPVQLTGQIQGDISELDIKQTVGEPLASTQSATITDLLSDLQWSVQLQAGSLNIADIVPEQTMQLTAVDVQANGNLESLTAAVSAQVIQTDMPPLAVTADISSKDFEVWKISSQANISEQSHLRVEGNISLADNMPSAQLEAIWQNLQWPLISDDVVAKSSDGTLTFTGSALAYEASLKTELEWQQQVLNLTAETKGSQTDLTITQLNINGLDGELNANGHLDWQTAPLQYQLNADWQALKLPTSLTELAVVLNQGEIKLNGTPDALSLSTQADIVVDDVSMTVNADASGQTATGFEQTSLAINLNEGAFQYQGKVLWAETLLLDGMLHLKNMNPGVLAVEWPGELSGNTRIKMENLPQIGMKIEASDIDIHGTLRQRPVKLKGAVNYSQALLDIKQLQLLSGDSSLQANGHMQQDKIDFSWVLKSPDLRDFYPDLKGQMDVTGSATGSLKTPEIHAELAAAEIHYQDIQVKKLSGQINLAMSKNAEINSQLALTGLDLPQLEINSLTLGISGRQQDHAINIAMDSQPLTLSLVANGALTEQTWRGQLQTFNFENAKAGQWTLQQQAELNISANAQQIPEHCWASDNGEFCLQAENSVKGWQASGQFDAVPLSLFEAFVIQLEQLQGTLRGDFNLTAHKDEAISGNGEIFLDDAALKLEQSAFNQQKPVTLNNTSLRYQIDAEKTHAMFHLEPDVDGVSAIDADFETIGLNRLLAGTEPAPIKGTVKTAIQDLSQLQLSHPAFTDLKGKFDLNLAVSGTTAQPQIEGQATLAQGQIAIIDAGIVLKKMEANINGNLDQIKFDYQASSGKGTLNGDGSFILKDKSWELQTALKAQQFTVMNTPEALVIAEPELTILVTPELTTVSGKVLVPEAELEPTQFNSTVSPSQDVVIIRDEPTPEQTGSATEVDIKIILGDKVKLKALGFQGRLTGDLRVTGNTNDILLGNGEIKIKDGSYLAYGQLLKIDDGSIRFAGGAIDNPELDIKAVRKGNDYKAGLHIEGFASAPQATLFSEPNMSQDNILSYILLGKPLDQASATDAALLASAASGLGLQNGAMIGDQIAGTFGLDEFTVRGDSAENAALHVGKYLSPKLYLSYGIGVFESVSTVELRYQLSKIWSLKAESGTESGVDLLYTYERGGPE